MPEVPLPWLALLRKDGLRRVLTLVLTCLATAILLMEYMSIPFQTYKEGDVVKRDLRAPVSFSYEDDELTKERRLESSDKVMAVFDYDASMVSKVQDRVSLAFDAARRKLDTAAATGLDDESRANIGNAFVATLEVSLEAGQVERLVDWSFDRDIEAFANELVGVALHRYVVPDRSLLPTPQRPIVVMRLLNDSHQELILDSYDSIVTPEEVRQDLSLYLMEHDGGLEPAKTKAASAIARASIRPNFSYNQRLTEERRQEANNSIPAMVHQVKKGTTLVRSGDVLGQRQVDMLDALNRIQEGSSLVGEVFALLAFSSLLLISTYLFATGFIRRFAREIRDLEAMAFILVICLALGRATLEASTSIFSDIGMGPIAQSVWYLVPIAGGTMLVRILLNGESALVFAVIASMLGGVMMERQALYGVYFLLSSVTAAGSISNTHERLHVLRGGLQTAVANGALVLIIDLVRFQNGPDPAFALDAVWWDVIFAMAGGILSAVMVLGLVPFFELFGFVTDYKLLEMANLNHPLLRQLMLRAPGTYHHSVIVGSLAEGAAEAIGANPLLARVAAYFHDIGKSVRPHYFVENQRDIPNPHDRLTPAQSAAILVNHVKDGAAVAREHNLPQPIIDNIWMHHGTGLIAFFYDRACRSVGPDDVIDPRQFRYPGPRPDTREAGVLLLADKVEAACRSIDRPTPDAIREKVQTIINGVISDGQLEECPITLKEIYMIANSFTDVLMGIHHQRIEYPQLPPPTNGEAPGAAARQSTITLEIHNPMRDTLDRAQNGNGRANGKGQVSADESQADLLDPSRDVSEDH